MYNNYQPTNYNNSFNQQLPYNQLNQNQFNTSINSYPPLYNPPPQFLTINKTKDPVIKNLSQFGDISNCIYCNRDTRNFLNHTIGCVTMNWAIVLLPCLLCWVPCCMSGCKDTECICQECRNVKIKVQANCC